MKRGIKSGPEVVAEHLRLGFIKIHRRILDNPVWQHAEYLRIWIYLILKANWKDRQSLNGRVIPRGSLVTGRVALAEGTGSSQKMVRDCLNHLKLCGMVTIESSKRGSIITICKYDTYQFGCNNSGPTEGQQRAKGGPTAGQQRANRGPLVKKLRREELEEEHTGFGANAPTVPDLPFDLSGETELVDPYAKTRDELWAAWPSSRRRCTQADMLAILHKAVKGNGHTAEALAAYYSAAKKYVDSAGVYVMRFREYARLVVDGPVEAPDYGARGQVSPIDAKPKLLMGDF